MASDVLRYSMFLGVIAFSLSFLIAAEAHLGMFTRVSGAEAWLTVTGMDLIGKSERLLGLTWLASK